VTSTLACMKLQTLTESATEQLVHASIALEAKVVHPSHASQVLQRPCLLVAVSVLPSTSRRSLTAQQQEQCIAPPWRMLLHRTEKQQMVVAAGGGQTHTAATG
jgi:hypothetical protein